MDVAETTCFVPGRFLVQGKGESDLPEDSSKPDLLILNQPIASLDVLTKLWKHSRYRLCADGGANRLFDLLPGDLKDEFLPNAINGDLDSLRHDVREYYAARGVRVTRDHDQESTDFGKAMRLLKSSRGPEHRREVLILGTLSGRVDQGLGLLHEMIREDSRDPGVRLWLFSECSVSFILRSSRNVIPGLISDGCFTRNVGILPVFGPAVISTSGLEWDVQHWPTQMGVQVSTSNHVVEDRICVETDGPVLFTIETNSAGQTSAE